MKRGSTSQKIHVFIQDNTKAAAGLAGLVYNSSGLTATYCRDGDTSRTPIAFVPGTLGTWVSSGFVEVGGGVYEIGLPNAALTQGNFVSLTLSGATNMSDYEEVIALETNNSQDAVDAIDLLPAPPSAPTIAGEVLDTVLSDHDISGTLGAEISAINSKTTNLPDSPAATGAAMTLTSAYNAAKGAAGANATATGFATPADVPTASTIAAAVWNSLTSGMTTVGSIGKKLADWVVGTLTSDYDAAKSAASQSSVDALAAVAPDNKPVIDTDGAVKLPEDAPSGYGGGDVEITGEDVVIK